MLERWQIQLEQQRQQGLYRQPPTVRQRCGKILVMDDGSRLLNFASNNYLGLGCDPVLANRVARHFERLGSSASSSRLVCAAYSAIARAEEALARYFGYESAIILPSGYQANLTLVSTLFAYQDVIFFDKRIHASMVKGLQLSEASFHGYNHNSMEHLQRRMEQRGCPGRNAVVTEALFSMDGDRLPVEGLNALKTHWQFLCVVDEAHSFGVLGPGGRGLGAGVADIATGTLGKAMGLFGAFLLLPHVVREYLLNFGSGLIYSTSLPEAHGAAVLEMLELLENSEPRRQHLAWLADTMKAALEREGFEVAGDAHILALQVGEEHRARELAQAMGRRGILCFAARYPTVPLGQAILRISLSALHDEQDIRQFIQTLKEAWHETGQETQTTLRNRNGH
ncbi:8-amino-7-oxononanoate synthase [Desulfurispirillum indicum S5]|uniref:8-amino-7-oxononanoate synthase n=1 Tax=Desulfurispirillum indicum (strain ATCC BAA-1389 / DSM 22839 / S5) TaxID=653733 RepID=E6W0J5_DESIS|nr:pyridoxal phosphate-dependent aminotransferase family protein [Desulfurispirillum indicum]ADU65247.1 8-amino-7-oxononanoate synthase [Desulfurispirillum indicum S5]